MSDAAGAVDSKEGIELLIRWAKTNGYVLAERHKRIAIKYNVPTDGVTFAGPIIVDEGHNLGGRRQ